MSLSPYFYTDISLSQLHIADFMSKIYHSQNLFDEFIFQPFWKPHHLISQGFLSRPPYSNKANGKIYGFFSLILRHELKNH